MKIIFYFTYFSFLLVITTKSVFGLDIGLPGKIYQGQTIPIVIEKNNITEISATFGNNTVNFFDFEKKLNSNEEINKLELFRLIFENFDFSEIDINSVKYIPDLAESDENQKYLMKACLLKVFSPANDGYFYPYSKITRSDLAKIIVLLFNPTPDLKKNISFSDMNSNHVNYKYILRLYQSGIISGYPDNTVKPDRFVTLGEVRIILKRILNKDLSYDINTRIYLRALIPVHRNEDKTSIPLSIKSRDNLYSYDYFNQNIKIYKRIYDYVYFEMDSKTYQLFGDKKLQDTWNMIENSKKNISYKQLWNGKFIKPTLGTKSLGFGDKLYINGSYAGSHFGIDYANSVGTPIKAANNGIVVLAKDTPSYGNTIVIDHGQNIYTMYLHLSSISVVEGQKVDKQEFIGFMGSTGVSTGSHLHYTQFIGDIIIDPIDWYLREY